jgi:hypothetical protein
LRSLICSIGCTFRWFARSPDLGLPRTSPSGQQQLQKYVRVFSIPIWRCTTRNPLCRHVDICMHFVAGQARSTSSR